MPWKMDRAFPTDNYELCLKDLNLPPGSWKRSVLEKNIMKSFREWLAEGVIEIPGGKVPVRTHYSTPTCHQENIRNIFNEDKTGLRRFC
ncbi:hypothetical protein TNCV_2938501 [Trichonephila clavipes]|nr:hypothetical protein TNCV_2938501 [Trichonephila clavipes]